MKEVQKISPGTGLGVLVVILILIFSLCYAGWYYGSELWELLRGS